MHYLLNLKRGDNISNILTKDFKMKRRENMENVTIIKKDMKKINKIEEKLSKYKLRENTIPDHSHGINLRHLLTKTTWDKLRQKIYERDKNQCVICGDKSPTKFHCHEEFSFDYENQIQRLGQLMTLCPHCHANKHIASKFKVFNSGKLTKDSMDRIIAHWVMVNFNKKGYFSKDFNIKEKQLKKDMKKIKSEKGVYIASVLSLTIERNTIAWKIDLNQNKIEKICEKFNIEMNFKSKFKFKLSLF